MVLSPDGHESPAERKRRRERARYARQQESRGVVVRSQRGRPRRNRPRLARTAAAAWWASQIPKWERDFQRGRAVRAIALARRVVPLANVCMHAVSVLARARRVSAAVQAAVNSEAAVAAAVAASSSAAVAAAAATAVAVPKGVCPAAASSAAAPGEWRLPPPGEWRLPPVLTWLVMEKWLRAQGAWRALACVCRATSGSDERAEAEREAAAREDAARAWAAIRADDVARLRRAFWPSGDRPKTEPREPTPRAPRAHTRSTHLQNTLRRRSAGARLGSAQGRLRAHRRPRRRATRARGSQIAAPPAFPTRVAPAGVREAPSRRSHYAGGLLARRLRRHGRAAVGGARRATWVLQASLRIRAACAVPRHRRAVPAGCGRHAVRGLCVRMPVRVHVPPPPDAVSGAGAEVARTRPQHARVSPPHGCLLIF